MKYYELKQDRKLRNLIEIEGFHGCPDIVLDRNMAEPYYMSREHRRVNIRI